MNKARRLQLTQGKCALVDASLYSRIVAAGSWYYDRRMKMAVLSHNDMRLNRFVCQLTGTSVGARVLHINGDTLDNRRCNLLADMQERLWSRVQRLAPSACWPWLGRTSGGYGHVTANGRETLAHRLIFEYAAGIKPGRMAAMHTCDNPRCCNPRHLKLGTWADNNRDRASKGRAKSHRRPN